MLTLKKSNGSSSKKIVVKVPNGSPIKASNAQIIVSSTKKRSRRSRSTRKAQSNFPRLSPQLLRWFKTLSCPFVESPIRLGYDTFLPTALNTAYFRGTVLMPNGCAFVIIWPCTGSFMSFATPATVTTNIGGITTTQGCANAVAISNQANMGRVISMGLRVYPLVAATSVPGIVQTGIAPKDSRANIVTNATGGTFSSVAAMQNLPWLQTHVKTPECDFIECSWRPEDNSDFEFVDRIDPIFSTSANTLTSTSPSDDTPTTNGPFILMTLSGFPNGTNFLLEAIMHLETTATVINQVSMVEDDVSPAVCDDSRIPNMESAYRTVQPMMPPAVTSYASGSSVIAPLVLAAMMRHARHDHPIGWVDVD